MMIHLVPLIYCVSAKRLISTTKPLILLDVDGVLNNYTTLSTWDKSVYKREIIRGFQIKWVPAVVEKFNSWSDNGLTEVRWLKQTSNAIKLCKYFRITSN